MAASSRLLKALNGPGAISISADEALIVPLKKSPEYRAVRARLAGPAPTDSWEDEGLHYFVFQMRAEEGAPQGAEPPVALFIMRHGEPGPASVLIIAMEPDGDYAVVTDLRRALSPGQQREIDYWQDRLQSDFRAQTERW